MGSLTSITEVSVHADVVAELGERARGAVEGTLSKLSCPSASSVTEVAVSADVFAEPGDRAHRAAEGTLSKSSVPSLVPPLVD